MIKEKQTGKATFFTPEWAQVGECITAGMDTIDLPSLDSTSAKPCLVSPPTVLLAQQHIHPALAPVCSLPAVTEDRDGKKTGQPDAWMNGWINRKE